jgi:hypothetical protein
LEVRSLYLEARIRIRNRIKMKGMASGHPQKATSSSKLVITVRLVVGTALQLAWAHFSSLNAIWVYSTYCLLVY